MEIFVLVEAYIDSSPKWKKELLFLREIALGMQLQETVKWGMPVYALHQKNIMGLAAFKSYVGIWFFNGSLLTDPHKVLVNAQEGKTKAMRQWRFKSKAEMNRQWIEAYIQEAIQNVGQGKFVAPSKKSPWVVPPELESLFATNEELHSAFKKLSWGKQEEYATYIAEAKLAATKEKRLERIEPMIMKGIGLNDYYFK